MSILSPALLGAVGLVMVAASLSHLRSPEALRRGLRAHQVLPERLHTPVSRVLGPLEAVLGAAALVVALTGAPLGAALLIGMPLAGLSLALALYLWQVLRVTAGQVVPCACGLGEAPVSQSAVLRGGILAVLAVAGATTANGWAVHTAPAAEIFVALAAMLVLALATALLPAARAVPEAELMPARAHDHGSHR
ncbi:hypothetical protein NF556_21165 [Ornithinimicrobium faecis]|uniref:Methylamine utilisation protein MauE domain-containing protein n=1 Tax=Ornithinimicrobium faecis TaxID=2934158 RepID=A0ABY4YTK4_9MICO|nr:MauE/DoxX family redox-associated membrane protein [Ornithinimicrobium sp. HY1793]USQ80063.1 hypothetical protein NF556_21165 [Ornithinimicrobium sp. HY1793]